MESPHCLGRDFEQLQEFVVAAGSHSCRTWERGSLAPSVYLQGTSRVPGRGLCSKDGVAADGIRGTCSAPASWRAHSSSKGLLATKTGGFSLK